MKKLKRNLLLLHILLFCFSFQCFCMEEGAPSYNGPMEPTLEICFEEEVCTSNNLGSVEELSRGLGNLSIADSNNRILCDDLLCDIFKRLNLPPKECAKLASVSRQFRDILFDHGRSKFFKCSNCCENSICYKCSCGDMFCGNCLNKFKEYYEYGSFFNKICPSCNVKIKVLVNDEIPLSGISCALGDSKVYCILIDSNTKNKSGDSILTLRIVNNSEKDICINFEKAFKEIAKYSSYLKLKTEKSCYCFPTYRNSNLASCCGAGTFSAGFFSLPMLISGIISTIMLCCTSKGCISKEKAREFGLSYDYVIIYFTLGICLLIYFLICCPITRSLFKKANRREINELRSSFPDSYIELPKNVCILKGYHKDFNLCVNELKYIEFLTAFRDKKMPISFSYI